MTDSMASRRRRAVYRANHRGSKEMDCLLGPFAGAKVESMSAETLTAFEQLLERPDSELERWILYAEGPATPEFSQLIADLRAFHAGKTARR
jgi:antitoxin CptB